MSLPYFQSSDKNMSLLQTNWASQLNPILANPINQGVLLKSIHLVNGTTQVNHTLGRPIQGYFLSRLQGPAKIYETNSTTPTLTLSLISDIVVTTDIYVF